MKKCPVGISGMGVSCLDPDAGLQVSTSSGYDLRHLDQHTHMHNTHTNSFRLAILQAQPGQLRDPAMYFISI